MLVTKVLRMGLAVQQAVITKLPKAPKLMAGELEPFRLDAEAARIYDGYSLDELYGSKIGFKHSPAMHSEMKKYQPP
jgi:hypothetical protein